MRSQKYNISCGGNQSFELVLPPPAPRDSFFAFSMHKAGSVMLNNMLRDYCAAKSIPIVDPHTAAWSNGIQTNKIGKDLERALRYEGYAYLGFRHYFTFPPEFRMDRVKKLFLLRDPRDMLTSLYFSHRYSHPIPDKEGDAKQDQIENRELAERQDINEFAINNAAFYVDKFEVYTRELLPSKNTKAYKYEDVVFDKENWLRSILEFLGDNLSNRAIETIVKRHDIRPSAENPSAHIRQVTPGNYKKYLSADTIALLNDRFYDIFNLFGYKR